MIRRSDLVPSRRGQTSLFDFFATVVIFITIFVMFLTLSDRAMRDSLLASDFSNSVSLGHTLSEAFVGSSGVPANWETDPSNVQSIGFATNQNDLDRSKLDAFIGMDYGASKAKMGIPPFIDYHFSVEDEEDTIIYESGVTRNRSHAILPFVRYAILDGEAVELKLVLYE